METMTTPQRIRTTQVADKGIAHKLFHSINRKAVKIARANGATGTGEYMIRVNVSIAYGVNDTSIYTRQFHLKFDNAAAAEDFGQAFAKAADQVNMFDRGVTFYIHAV